MISAKNYFVLIILVVITFSSCRRESMQLRSSVRKTQNDAKYFNRDINQVKNLLGLEAIESDEEESEEGSDAEEEKKETKTETA